MNCVFSIPGGDWVDGGLSRIIGQSTSADLNDSGSQPVLTFTYKSDNQVETTAIITSADYKSIVEIYFSAYEPSSRQVNLGTLVNPNVVTQTIQTNQSVVVCK